MKLTNEQLQTYLRGMAKERGFDETRTGKLVSLVSGEGDVTLTRAELKELLEPIVEHPLSRQSEFSSAMDRAQQQYLAVDRWRREVAEPAVTKEQERAAKLEQRIEAFKARYGDIEDVTDMGGGTGVTATGEKVNMDKVNELMAADRQARSREFWEYQLDASRIRTEHFNRFKELPDEAAMIAAIAAAANDPVNPRRLSLDDVYKERYGEKVQKYNQEQEEKRIEDLVQKRITPQRARPNAPRSGASAEDGGVFWGQHKDADAPAPAAGGQPTDLASAFNADFETTLAAETAGASTS